MKPYLKDIYRFLISVTPIILVLILKPSEGIGRAFGKLVVPFFLVF